MFSSPVDRSQSTPSKQLSLTVFTDRITCSTWRLWNRRRLRMRRTKRPMIKRLRCIPRDRSAPGTTRCSCSAPLCPWLPSSRAPSFRGRTCARIGASPWASGWTWWHGDGNGDVDHCVKGRLGDHDTREGVTRTTHPRAHRGEGVAIGGAHGGHGETRMGAERGTPWVWIRGDG